MLNDVLQVTVKLDQEFKSTQIRYIFFPATVPHAFSMQGLYHQLREFLQWRESGLTDLDHTSLDDLILTYQFEEGKS